MKRIMAAVLLAAVTLSVAATAFAQGNYMAPKRAIKELVWRTHTAANGANNDFARDSAITNRLGTQIMVLDTTAGVSTLGWRIPEHPVRVVADSNTIYCQLFVTDGGSSSSTADSLYIMAQASYDGKNYFNLATFLGGTPGTATSRLDQTVATGTFFGRLNMFGASGSTPQWEWTYKNRAPIVTATDQTSLHRYPWLRWIVGFPDAVNYSVRARVMYTTTSSDE